MSPKPVTLESPASIPGAAENAEPIPADILAAPVVEAKRPPLPNIKLSERSRKDPSFLDLDPATMDPSRVYRWVRCRADEHHLSIVSTKLEGYEIEYWRDGGPRPLVETEMRPDKVIAVGDLILMSCSKLNDEIRQQEQFARREGILAAATAQTEEMAREKGVRVIKDADHA